MESLWLAWSRWSIALALSLVVPCAAAQVWSDDSKLIRTNTGELRRLDFTGHDLTPVGADGAGPRILYAPAEADDLNYRAEIAAAAGGAVVDYFDARVATPSLALLASYDCCYTWPNFAYFDNVGFGNNLAAACDAGLDVVLGTFCTYTSGNFLSGAIMTSAYCPVVSPLGNNHFTASSYVGDGQSCMYGGVTTLSCVFRDFLATQGSGVVDGTYADGEICGAIRPNPGGGAGEVVYNNGGGASQLGCLGDWATFAARSCTCKAGSGVFGACTFFNGGGTNPVGYTCTNVPIAGQNWLTTVAGDPAGVATLVIVGSGGTTSGAFLFGGEVLVAGPTFIFDLASGVSHNIAIPPSVGGATVATQGAVVTTTTVILRNAQIATVGSSACCDPGLPFDPAQLLDPALVPEALHPFSIQDDLSPIRFPDDVSDIISFPDVLDIKVAPPDDSDSPYVGGVDFGLYFDPLAGKATALFTEGGPYVFQIDTSAPPFQFFFVAYVNTAPNEKKEQCKGSGGCLPNFPDEDAFDLVLVEDANGAAAGKGDPPLDDDAAVFDNEKCPKTVEEAVAEILAAAGWTPANPNCKKIKLAIVGHGAAGNQSIGAGKSITDPNWIGGTGDGKTDTFTKAPPDGVKGCISEMWLLGCKVGKDESGTGGVNGKAKLKELANGLKTGTDKVKIHAYDASTIPRVSSKRKNKFMITKNGQEVIVESD